MKPTRTLRRIGLTLLVGAFSPTAALWGAQLEAWEHWLQQDPSSTVQVDHGEWQHLLSQYVSEHQDGINRVAYGNFDQAGKAALNRYLAQLSAIEPTKLNRQQQLAYWINLYNAQTVKVVLDHPSKTSIRSMGPFFAFGPWDEPYLSIEGKAVTLNDIEHRILRPIWTDHRLHFVLNCASIGCPNLSRQAYTAENVERRLAEAETAFLQHPRAITIKADNSLQLSSLFDWYLTDFANDDDALLTYLATHRRDLDDLLNRLQRPYGLSIDYVYDWDLNKNTQ